MNETKMYGRVKWFDNKTGEGYILGADNESYFFDLLSCVKSDCNFFSGDEVLFIPNFIDLTATLVEKSGENVVN